MNENIDSAVTTTFNVLMVASICQAGKTGQLSIHHGCQFEIYN